MRQNHPLLLPGLLVLSCLSLLLTLRVGGVSIDWETFLEVFSGDSDPLTYTLIMELRLPRALNAFAVGGLLALSGTLMQVLLRNPLADPYILGVSGGAAVGALGCMLLGLGGFWLHGSSFAGALISMFLVFGLARSGGSWTPSRLLLTGVVIAAGWGALISFLLAVAPERNLHGMLFWLMGDLGPAGSPWVPLITLMVGLLLCLPIASSLNVLARGELQAAALGVAVGPLRIGLYIIASFLAASAVTVAGSIGFVGLIVPHMVRIMGGHDHRRLLPAVILLGGSLLLIADSIARTLLAPRQLPVGVITAMIGVPIFLYLLQRTASRR